MIATLFLRCTAWLGALVPTRLRENKMQSFVGTCVMVSATLWLCTYFASFEEAMATGTMAVTLMLAVLAVYLGVSLQTCIRWVLCMTLATLAYAVWGTGGIFSPYLAWLSVVPVVAFFLVGQRQGLWWAGVVYVFVAVAAYATAQAWLDPRFSLDAGFVSRAFVTNLVVPITLILAPWLYDNLYKRGLLTSKERTDALESKKQELLRASEVREHFIANVSHELRTPMNAILGFNAMLLTRVHDRPEALRILNHTRQSADHLLTVINDVLDHSQLQAGHLSVHKETFALRDAVQNAFGLFQMRVQSMRIDYRCIIDADVPVWVNTDRHRLMQVLVNLLGNAIKFTHQGHVHVRVRAHDSGVRFLVEDTGIGIAKEQRAHIFERFSQANDSIQSRYGGNGLGLSISQRLVHVMGGEIGFDSEPGAGAVFWFDLPLREVSAPILRPATAGVVHASANVALRFLVVDDHPMNRLLIRQILRNTWHNSVWVEADTGLKALQVLKEQTFDVVLMDMVMPEMDGIEATRTLRMALPAPACNTPVLGLTANVNPQDLQRFYAAGVNAVLLKPFDQEKLCEHVETLMAAQRKVSPKADSL
jgi:signal transduction histidine kinase/ActR/RegA family two-component response regulator